MRPLLVDDAITTGAVVLASRRNESIALTPTTVYVLTDAMTTRNRRI